MALNAQEYDACPYCLTEIVVGEPHIEAEPVLETRAKIDKEPEIQPARQDKPEASPKGHCSYHFGYLSERTGKECIPEECIVCEEIVKCMLKSVKG